MSSPDDNTANFMVCGNHTAPLSGARSTATYHLSRESDNSFSTPSFVMKANSINLRTLGPTTVQGTFHHATLPYSGYYAVLLHGNLDVSGTSADITTAFSTANGGFTASLRPVGITPDRIQEFYEGWQDVSHTAKPVGLASSVSGRNPETGDLMTQMKIAGTTVNTSDAFGVFERNMTNRSNNWSRTAASTTASFSSRDYFVLACNVHAPVFNGGTRYTSTFRVDVPSRYDLAASGSFGWADLKVSIVNICPGFAAGTALLVPPESVQVCILPAMLSKPAVCRDWNASHIFATYDTHKIVNVVPISVTWQAGSTPVQIALPAGASLPVTIPTPMPVRLADDASALAVSIAGVVTTTPLAPVPVCGAIGNYPRVPVGCERLVDPGDGRGMEALTLPLTISNRAGIKEYVGWPYATVPGGLAPLVLDGSIGTPVDKDTILVDDGLLAPIPISGSVSVIGTVPVSVQGTAAVAVMSSCAVEVRAAASQDEPLWTSEIRNQDLNR